jgi:transposase
MDAITLDNLGGMRMISIGIDAAKGKSTICIMKSYGEILVPPRDVAHTASELQSLVFLLKSFGEPVRAVMESTGTYHHPILKVLLDAGVFVSVENPLVIKKYAAVNLRKGKTDKLDAIKLAQYGLEKWLTLKPYEPCEAVYEELKLLGRQYTNYIETRVAALNRLLDLLDQTSPGIDNLLQSHCADKTKCKLCDFVETFWHFDSILKKSEKSFIAAYNTWAKKKGYRPSESKAKEIYALAKDGTPTLSSSMPSAKMLTLESIRNLNSANLTLATILSQMQLLASQLPEYTVVSAMKGVGERLSVLLIAEIGDVRRFHNGSALVAYAGLDAPPFQSGAFDGTKRHISKRGSPQLRKLCFEVMMALKLKPPKEDSAVYDFMLKKEAEGKPKMVAKVAAMNKFLRIYYARTLEAYAS